MERTMQKRTMNKITMNERAMNERTMNERTMNKRTMNGEDGCCWIDTTATKCLVSVYLCRWFIGNSLCCITAGHIQYQYQL